MNYALLLLAGSSSRFNSKQLKQFYIINKHPLFYYPLIALEKSKEIDGIIVLTTKEKVIKVYNYIIKEKIKKIKAVIAGGNSRSETVKIGLNKLREFAKDSDIVLIHDAARALLKEEDIKKSIFETLKKGATTFAIRSYDTLVLASNDYQVNSYVDRNKIFRLQTPQTFVFSLIYEAHSKNKDSHFDDTELIHLLNKSIYLIKGEERLFKVTTFEDIERLKALLAK